MSIFSSARKDRADTYLPMQRQILSTYFNLNPNDITEAPLLLDMSEAVDLLLPNGTRIAVRTRYKEYDDICFRHSNDSLRKTEWQKVCEGLYPPFYLYTVATGATIGRWWLLDTTVIADAHKRGWTRCQTYRERPDFGDGVVLVGLNDYQQKFGNRPFILASSDN